MQNKMAPIFLAAILLLASCAGPAPGASSQGSESLPEVSSSHDPAYPFYSDAEFLQKAYAMGYSDYLLKFLWDMGHTVESLLSPPLSTIYDTSPDGKWSLYQAATPSGSMLRGLEHVCLINNESGKVTVIGAQLVEQRLMTGANICFISNDLINYIDSSGGAVLNLQGEVVQPVALDPEGSGYYIPCPAYDPATNLVVGLGVAYKTAISVDYETDKNLHRTFVLIKAETSGELINTALSDTPMEVNKYHQIISPHASYVSDGYLWVAITAGDGGYLYYRIGTDTYETEVIDSATFSTQFPHYPYKG